MIKKDGNRKKGGYMREEEKEGALEAKQERGREREVFFGDRR